MIIRSHSSTVSPHRHLPAQRLPTPLFETRGNPSSTSRMLKILPTRVDFRDELGVPRHPDVLRGSLDGSLCVWAHGSAPQLRSAVAGLRLQSTAPPQSVCGADQGGGVVGPGHPADAGPAPAAAGVHPSDDLRDAVGAWLRSGRQGCT